MYNYQGECDLVVTHSKTFGNGKGLDLHIRTTMEEPYSYIESAAIRIGGSILEVNIDDQFIIDGTKYTKEDLPLEFAGYALGAPYMYGTSTSYNLDFGNGGRVAFRHYKPKGHPNLLSVDIRGIGDDFQDAEGLMGSYPEGRRLSRAGEDMQWYNEFGAEWQVRPGIDPILFSEARAPQWPASCNMPAVTQRRHLRGNPNLLKNAEKACARKDPKEFDFCVADILVTGDEGMAGAW